MGKNDPSEALMASTRVLAIETPTALTPWPNMMAPKPHAKPVRIAEAAAPAGAILRIRMKPGVVAPAIATGIRTHETRIKMDHTFSQDHRPRYFMGRAKAPHMMPAMMAKVTPNVTAEPVRVTRVSPCLLRSPDRQSRRIEIQLRGGFGASRPIGISSDRAGSGGGVLGPSVQESFHNFKQ